MRQRQENEVHSDVVPGCSTGEEVYSIAVALLEYLWRSGCAFEDSNFRHGLNERGIQIARNGLYAAAAVENVSRDRLRRFFIKTESGYQIAKSIREICVFARHDLAKDPAFARLDLISCQNVFIYLGRPSRGGSWVLSTTPSMPSGYLVLGKSEAPTATPSFSPLKTERINFFHAKRSRCILLPAIGPLSPAGRHIQSALSQRRNLERD